MADENAHLACEKLVQLGKVCSGLACGDGYSQLRIHCDEVVGGGEVSFSETEDGGDSRSMGCHKDAIDHAWTRWGVSKSRNDDHLIGISDDRALMGVSVVCGAPEHSDAFFSVYDSSEGSLGSRHVAVKPHFIANND